MKPKIRTPFFETSVKNYIYGDAVLEMAVAADRAAVKYDVDVLFISPYTEIRRIRENCPHLIILAPYMDTIRPGRGMADVLPEALKAAGSTDSKAVNEALWDVTYDGVSGYIAFNEIGDADRDSAYIKTANTETGAWDFVTVQTVE